MYRHTSDMETLDTDALREAAKGVVGQYGFLELLMIRCVLFFFNDGLTARNPKKSKSVCMS